MAAVSTATAAITRRALDLFAGAGGWDLAAHALGIESDGVEWMPEAQLTRDAAGLSTVSRNVWTVPTVILDSYGGLITSPPCQTFSTAGGGTGRDALDDVLALIPTVATSTREELRAHGVALGDDRTALVLSPLWYALHMPNLEWTAWEQVPAVLPVWEACAEVLRAAGWNVWTGVVTSERYGVAQTRRRAVLIGSRTRPVAEPPATHSRYYSTNPERLDPDVPKWTSMAEALGWANDELVGFPRLADTPSNKTEDGGGVVTIDGVDYRARDLHTADQPAHTLTEKVRSWERRHPDSVVRTGQATQVTAAGDLEPYERSTDAPAPTVTGTANRWKVHPAAFVAGGIAGEGTPRTVDAPAPTLTGVGAAAWLDDPNDYQGTASAPGPARQAVYRGSNAANAAIRPLEHPAPTVMFGNATNDVRFYPAGETERGVPELAETRSPGSRQVTIAEAGVLQSFPADYPWQGGKSLRYLQAGNAVPPLMARAVLAEAVGVPNVGDIVTPTRVEAFDLFDLL
jgi:DNA (cytosine-5)-methyltransferase 1